MSQKEYVVQPGDTIWKIARNFGITVSEILDVNPAIENPELIYPGQSIKLPTGKDNCNYKPFPDQDEIDLSGIKYICSETKRDQRLEKALKEEFNLEEERNQVRYYYNKVDLNDDGINEVFAYPVGPPVCGTGGCSAAIFKRENGEYKLLSRFSLVNNPIIISNNKTNGYRDIIMYVTGGGIESFFAELKYNGTSYPGNPSVQPEVKPGTKVSGIAIIADDISKNPGIPLT